MRWRTVSLTIFLGTVGLAASPPGCEEQKVLLREFESLVGEGEDFRPPVEGQITVYSSNGPLVGGSVQALAMGPDGTLYAGFFGDGVYKSTDGGETWRPAKSGLGDRFILSLYIHRNGTLFAGTVRKGLYRSHDGGENWMPSGEGLANDQIASMTAGPDGSIYVGTGAGVFVSRDGGRHWDTANKGLEIVLVRSIVATPSGSLFIGTAGNGLLRSHDNGQSWQRLDRGLRNQGGLKENFIRTLNLSANGTLYAGTFDGGVFASTDMAQTWYPMSTGLSNDSIRSLAIAEDGQLFVGTGRGVFSRPAGSGEWVTISEAVPDVSVQSMILAPDGTLFVGTPSGILKKSPQTTAWQILERGITFPVIQTLLFDPERGILAGTRGSGVYRGKDSGKVWEHSSEGMINSDVRFLTQDARRNFYAGTDTGVYRSDPKGKRWSPLQEGMGRKKITALALIDNDVLYAGTGEGLYQRIIRTPEEGEKGVWATVALPPSSQGRPKIQGIASKGSSEVYVATESRLFRTRRGMTGWEMVAMKPLSEEIRGMVLQDRFVYLWTAHTLFRASTGQRSFQWERISQGIPDRLTIQSVAVRSGKHNGIVLVGTEEGLFWTQDGGENWTPAAGRMGAVSIRAIHPLTEELLLLGSHEQGVLYAVDLT